MIVRKFQNIRRRRVATQRAGENYFGERFERMDDAALVTLFGICRLIDHEISVHVGRQALLAISAYNYTVRQAQMLRELREWAVTRR